jgi:hypothetical protein
MKVNKTRVGRDLHFGSILPDLVLYVDAHTKFV